MVNSVDEILLLIRIHRDLYADFVCSLRLLPFFVKLENKLKNLILLLSKYRSDEVSTGGDVQLRRVRLLASHPGGHLLRHLRQRLGDCPRNHPWPRHGWRRRRRRRQYLHTRITFVRSVSTAPPQIARMLTWSATSTRRQPETRSTVRS